jgi:hypothetical protein
MGANSKKMIPICFSPEQFRVIESYAKVKGMLNAGQLIEDILKEK